MPSPPANLVFIPGSDGVMRVDIDACCTMRSVDQVQSLRIATGKALSQVESTASGPTRRFLAAVRELKTKQRQLRLARHGQTSYAR